MPPHLAGRIDMSLCRLRIEFGSESDERSSRSSRRDGLPSARRGLLCSDRTRRTQPGTSAVGRHRRLRRHRRVNRRAQPCAPTCNRGSASARSWSRDWRGTPGPLPRTWIRRRNRRKLGFCRCMALDDLLSW